MLKMRIIKNFSSGELKFVNLFIVTHTRRLSGLQNIIVNSLLIRTDTEHTRLSDPVKTFTQCGKFMDRILMGIKILLFRTRKTRPGDGK